MNHRWDGRPARHGEHSMITRVAPSRSPQMTSPPKEAWNLDRFLAAYDAVAVRRKGWAFERTPDRIAYAQ
jgi:hypothetical protein